MNKKLTSFHLKIIAIVSMTINHIGHVFEPNFHPPWWKFLYLTIGKLTFPIMAYLLIEGLRYTKSFSHYLRRLLIYAILSILPFHFALVNTGNVYILNNILFTLSIGLTMIKMLDTTKRPYQTHLKSFDYILLLLAMIITSASDWNIIGVILIWVFYKHPKNYAKQLTIFSMSLTIVEYIATSNLMALNHLGILLVIPILNQYNGQKGFSNNIIKYGFYIYYPLHLTILWLISLYLNG